MERVSTYTLIEEIFSHSRKEHVGKYIPLKYIPPKTGVPFIQKEMLEDGKEKQVRTKTGGPLKDKDILGYEKVKWVRTYTDAVSTRRSTG